MAWKEKAKRKAAVEAVKDVEDGFIIGLGSGSTAAYVIKEIAKKIKREQLNISGVPTSYQSFLLAANYGVPTTTLNEILQLDLTIDGADQIDKSLNLIKGMGGALTREKIVASASKKLVIVADETKLVEKLGMNQQPVPVEVLPFAYSIVMSKIREMGGKPSLREGTGKVGPVITDNGNFVVDVDFGPIDDPKRLNPLLKSMLGVIETGLFIEMANIAYVGKEKLVQKLERA